MRRFVLISLLLVAVGAKAHTIAILGTGDVGSTLGRRWAEAGHEIVYGSRHPGSARVLELVSVTGPNTQAMTPAKAAAVGDVVVLAVPYHAIAALLPTLGDMQRKVVIDCTNPLTADLDGLTLGVTTSAAETIASLLPGARVVKALNTTGVANMKDSTYQDGPLTMLIAGESAMAKKLVSGLVEELGFEVVDAGPLASARWLEPMAMLWIELAYRQGMGSDIGFKLIRR